jgi:hypothetical protein
VNNQLIAFLVLALIGFNESIGARENGNQLSNISLSCGKNWKTCKPNYVDFEMACKESQGIFQESWCSFPDGDTLTEEDLLRIRRELGATCFEVSIPFDNIENMTLVMSYKGPGISIYCAI